LFYVYFEFVFTLSYYELFLQNLKAL